MQFIDSLACATRPELEELYSYLTSFHEPDIELTMAQIVHGVLMERKGLYDEDKAVSVRQKGASAFAMAAFAG